MKQKDKIVITFTPELLEEWTKIYLKKHPRTKKKPIAKPIHESLNVWTIMRRPMANALKQKWKEFVQFCVDYYKLNDLGISKCKCKYIAHKGYVKSKRRSDIDNLTPKFILDGLTAECSGVLVDDSCDCIEEMTIKIIQEQGIEDYSEIIFYDCEYDVDLMLKTRKIEINKTLKKEETKKENKAKKKTTNKKTKKK